MAGTEFWSRLKDSAGNMDVAQITYVMSQESVKEVYREMMKSFTSFLFEQFKEDFASVPAYQPIVERYVDTVIKAAENFGQHARCLEEENNRLKQELEKLRNAG